MRDGSILPFRHSCPRFPKQLHLQARRPPLSALCSSYGQIKYWLCSEKCQNSIDHNQLMDQIHKEINLHEPVLNFLCDVVDVRTSRTGKPITGALSLDNKFKGNHTDHQKTERRPIF